MNRTRNILGVSLSLLIVLASVTNHFGAEPGATLAFEPGKSIPALLAERIAAAKRAYDQVFESYRQGIASHPAPEGVYQWSRRWLEAELEATQDSQEQFRARQRHFSRMAELERYARGAAELAGNLKSWIPAVSYFRIEAELWLVQSRNK